MTSPYFDLTGKVALVTGGSRGLGYQMAKAFALHGADVIVASRKLDNCEAVAAEIRAMGRRSLAHAAHCGRWDDIDHLIEASYAAFGRVDILVNNAGSGPRMASHEVTESLFDSVLNLNFKGPFRLASLVAKRMVDGDGGSIINISSSGSLVPLPHVVPYGSAKAALNAIRDTTTDFIPGRNWIRRLSGAEQHSKHVQSAIQSGRMRRAFLKGMGMQRNCAPPAAASWFRPHP